MRGADTGQTAGNNLAPLGDELLQQAHIAVVDGVDLLDAELADLLAAEELASAAARTTGAGAGRPSAGTEEDGPGPSDRELLGALGVLVSSAMVFLFLLPAPWTR